MSFFIIAGMAKVSLISILLFCCVAHDVTSIATNPSPGNLTTYFSTTVTNVTISRGKVLFISPVGSKSHHNFYYGIIDALANANYEVRLIHFKIGVPFHLIYKCRPIYVNKSNGRYSLTSWCGFVSWNIYYVIVM